MRYSLIVLIGVVLLLSVIPVCGMSQTTGIQTPYDQTTSSKVEQTESKHTAKKSSSDTPGRMISNGYHATARATGKAWNATKHGVATGYQATAHATGKAWSGTKKAVSKGYNNTVHPHANATDRSNVKQPDQVKQEGETK